jgi:hypothetical protein
MSTNYEVPHCATSSIPLEETLGIIHGIQEEVMPVKVTYTPDFYNPVASTI